MVLQSIHSSAVGRASNLGRAISEEDSSKVADDNDRATLEEEFALELRTRDRERQLISKIDKTLHLIEMGDYGYCKTCGAEIALPRLEARPTADECIDCKTIAERKEV
jgi:DnaK suppressor protein